MRDSDKNFAEFTDAELEIAKDTDMPALLERLGYQVTRKGRYHSTKEIDSLRIKNRRIWFRYSENIGGDTISFLRHFHGMSFIEAMDYLLALNGYSRTVPDHVPSPAASIKTEEAPVIPFALPPANDEQRHVYAYLRKRSIAHQVINAFLSAGLLYEDTPFHNCVFVGRNTQDIPAFACKRGTYDKEGWGFKGDVEGSDKNVAFPLPCDPTVNTIHVFESPIDLMNYMTLHRELRGNAVALCCLHDGALETYLTENPHLTDIVLCLDADKWGLEASGRMSEKYAALGYTVSTLLPPSEKDWNAYCVTSGAVIHCTQEQQEQAVIRLCAKDGGAKEIATDFGVTASTVYRWRDRLLGERRSVEMPQEKNPFVHPEGTELSHSIEDLLAERDVLTQQLEELKKDVYHLQMEKDILEMAGELLKKVRGINPRDLSNREKAVLIDALRNRYRLKELLIFLDMAKSSYCYQRLALLRADQHADLRASVKDAFSKAQGRYGYRRIHSVIKRMGTRVSEKVIRRIMGEEGLRVASMRKRKYNSYAGEISPEVENLIDRDFSAQTPNEKWLTDITEFSIPAGKAYLSPIADCFDGLVVAWTIGTSPNAELVDSMLDAGVSLLTEGEHPIVHSDRGCHYRWPGWLERMKRAELTRSMSKKGCSPDNAACEGFFGRVKNEMFYGRSWWGVTMEAFIDELDSYLRWYNQTRIKMSLGGMSPLEYRQSLGLTTKWEEHVS